jgi:hypothetical protein
VNWVVADIFRIKDDALAEHWDAIQNEAAKDESKSGLPMFGDKVAERSSAARQGALIARREGLVAGPRNHLTEISRNPTR